jgi:hypothetical protein
LRERVNYESKKKLEEYGDFLTTNDLMDIFKISYPTALNLLSDKPKKGKILAFKITERDWRIRKKDVEDFIQESLGKRK